MIRTQMKRITRINTDKLLKPEWLSDSKAIILAKVSNLRKDYVPKTISFIKYNL